MKYYREVPHFFINFQGIVFFNRPKATEYSGLYHQYSKTLRSPILPMGTNIKGFLIALNSSAIDLTAPHRVGGVNLLEGTLGHELTKRIGHSIYEIKSEMPYRFDPIEFIYNWYERFSWVKITRDPKTLEFAKKNGWSKDRMGYWCKDDIVCGKTWITEDPESCIHPYQLLSPYNQLADVFVCMTSENGNMEEHVQFLKDLLEDSKKRLY